MSKQACDTDKNHNSQMTELVTPLSTSATSREQAHARFFLSHPFTRAHTQRTHALKEDSSPDCNEFFARVPK